MSRLPIIEAGREERYATRLAGVADVSPRSLRLTFEESRAERVELLVDGAQFYPAMLRDIEAATRAIHINEFGFRPGVVGDQFAEVLARKAREGVVVRLLIDERGSDPAGCSREMYQELVAAGVQVGVTAALRPRAAKGPLAPQRPVGWNIDALGHIDHRKMLVIDGKIGWVGGAGFEDHFLNGGFHDLFVRVEGPVVRQLQLLFLVSLRCLGLSFAAEEVPALFPDLAPTGGDAIPTTVLLNAANSRVITRAIEELIDGVKDTLDIANPYLSDRSIIARLRAAARRGARVRLLVPAIEQGRAALIARRHYHAAMLADGIEIWGFPRMIHAKALVGDGERVLVGSCNLEVWSLRRFLDLDLRLRSSDLAQAFARDLFEPGIALSRREEPARGAERLLATAYAAAWPLI